MAQSTSISRERMATACRRDACRITMIATPVFAAGFVLEAVSHANDPDTRMVMQPALSACLCASVLFLGRAGLRRIPYPELLLLGLWGLVMWCIALHLPAVAETTRASTLVMLAVAAVGSATLIMPSGAALLAVGFSLSLYTFAQTTYLGTSGPSGLVAPMLVSMVIVIIYWSRRSAIRSVEELRERVARDQQELERVNERLRSLSVTDPLTEALNRRGFDERLRAELVGSARSGEPLSLLMMDVDHFKRYNDEFGHPAGDAALVAAARALRSCCRGNDSLVRYGGEEFALILPATDASGSRRMAERVRRAIATMDGLCRPITASVGAATVDAATVRARHADHAGALVAAADGALYRAKQRGRDRTEFAGLARLDECTAP
ncbi:MAG: GGDEF domain-containing protein [Halieaceae bacterium]|jgi:diguanylate cyclase (GGDEF)-like protein|nr:GGDEF domain-containing protein [Halieaceae bacterium]